MSVCVCVCEGEKGGKLVCEIERVGVRPLFTLV